MGDILIGTSGFSFDDWIGEVYPARIRKQEMLPYYENNLSFKALEVNYTYYALPSKRTMESFRMRTSGNFCFTVKAYKGMTHEREAGTLEQFKAFREGVSPLGDRCKALLFQFPYGFLPTKANMDYLRVVREEFHDFESVIEFRNAKWFDEASLDILRELSLGYCIVDEPKLKGLLPFHPALTSKTGYFRFHGRNKAWFREPMEVRYNYLYTEQELEEFVEPIRDVARRAETTFVFFNNCHAGKAVKNALTLKDMLAQ